MAGRRGRWSGLVVVFLWILMGHTTLLRAQGVRYDNIVLGPRGGPVGAATIAVCSSSATTATTPCSPLATIYSDEALTQPLANPMKADSLGNYGFWAAPGHYVVQIYGAGVTTRTMNVFLPCDPSNCSMSNATFSSITAGTLNLTGALTVNGRGVATKPLAGDAVMYVSPNGSDSNDGLSWGTAMQTLYAAVQSLEATVKNGGWKGGTLYVADNTSCGGPVAGQGLWLYRNATNPGTGWLYMDSGLNIIGVGGPHWGGNTVGPEAQVNCGSSTQPSIELIGINAPLRISNLITTGSIPLDLVDDDTTITFDNDTFNVNSSVATNGPAAFIGYSSFWLFFRHCTFTANGNSGKTAGADAAEAVTINPGSSNPSAGLIFINESTENSGDVKFYPGNTSASLYVNGLTAENQTDGKGAVWITSAPGAFSGTIMNVTVADATTNPTTAVEVDSGGPAQTLVGGASGYGINVSGPMTLLSQYANNLQDVTVDPWLAGQNGFTGGHVYGQVDAGRRLFAPTAIPWANLVNQIPSAWAVQSDGTVTKNYVTGPDGATGMALDINQAGGTYTPSVNFTQSGYAFAVGDYVIAGAWYRRVTGSSYAGGVPLQLVMNGSGCSATPTFDGKNSGYIRPPFGADAASSGEWEWGAVAERVTASSGTCYVNFSGNYAAGTEMQFFAPVVLHIPTGQVTDNEAAEITANLAPYPDSLNPPVEATLRGHPFAFGGSGDNFFATLDHTALTTNRTYSFPDNSGTVCLGTTCGGQVGQITISSATSGSHSFGTSYKSAPVCIVSPTSSPGSTTWWVTSSTSSVTVTLSASSTMTFNYSCFGNPN